MTTAALSATSLAYMPNARVCVSHRSPAVRLGLEHILEQQGVEVLRGGQEPAHGDSAPLVILADRPGACAELAATTDPRPRVLLAIIDSDDPGCCEEGVQAGAHGVVALTWEPETIALAVRVALSGLVALPLHRVRRPLAGRVWPAPPDLSQQETSLLRDLADGRTIGQLAAANGYSERTISRMARALYRKLGAEDRLRAVAKAARLGLLE